MPEGAYYEKLTTMARLETYIERYGASLYGYANNTRERRLKNGELSVVFSCRKATSWGIATVQNTAPERKIQMNFLERERVTSQSAGAHFKWGCRGTVQAKVGPEDENDDLVLDGDDTPTSSIRNQCLFVRTVKIKLAETVWKQLCPVVNVIMDEEIAPSYSHLTPPPPSSDSSSSLSPPSSQLLGSVYSPPTSVSSHDSDSNASISIASSDDEEYNEQRGASSVSRLHLIFYDLIDPL